MAWWQVGTRRGRTGRYFVRQRVYFDLQICTHRYIGIKKENKSDREKRRVVEGEEWMVIRYKKRTILEIKLNTASTHSHRGRLKTTLLPYYA